jgi:hypothetical protein
MTENPAQDSKVFEIWFIAWFQSSRFWFYKFCGFIKHALLKTPKDLIQAREIEI